MIKKLIIFITALVFSQATNAQSPKHNPLIGRWNVVKVALSPEMFFDLEDRDSTRCNFLRQYKEKNFGSGWSFKDNLAVEKMYAGAMAEMEKMYMHFTNDSTYEGNGMEHGGGPTPGKVVGSYKFNLLTKVPETTDNGITIELKVLTLNETTLVLERGDKIRQLSLRHTLRRATK